MKTKHVLIFVLAIALNALAQTSNPAALFKQHDKNADGKLTADELNMPNLFGRLNKDNDGFVTEAKFDAFFGKRARPVKVPRQHRNPQTQASNRARTATKPRRPGSSPIVLAKLDIAMQQAVANKEVSGVIGLIHRNGERGYFEAFGWQDIEAQKPLPKDAIFRLQSMTKPVIAACACRSTTPGKFTLDEPISKHLPEWKEPKVLENGKLVPAKFAITPRMLMSHSQRPVLRRHRKGSTQQGGQRRRRPLHPSPRPAAARTTT